MKYFQTAEEGAFLSVKVTPKASLTKICKWEQNTLKISVTAPADKNLANEMALELLAKTFHLAKNKISLLRGEKSRNKIFLFLSECPKKLDEMLNQLLS